MQSFYDWLKTATPDEKITAAKTTLASIGELETTHQERFVQEVRSDPVAGKVFEDLKATI